MVVRYDETVTGFDSPIAGRVLKPSDPARLYRLTVPIQARRRVSHYQQWLELPESHRPARPPRGSLAPVTDEIAVEWASGILERAELTISDLTVSRMRYAPLTRTKRLAYREATAVVPGGECLDTVLRRGLGHSKNYGLGMATIVPVD